MLQGIHSRPLFVVLFVVVALVTLPLSAWQLNATEPVDFNRDIRPILSDRCFHCHGPDAQDRQADLRLDQAQGPEGAFRESGGTYAIKPGDVSASEVWARITSEDPDLVMPPPDSHKQPLNEKQQEQFKTWISQGASYEAFWSFIPPKKPALASSNIAPIDQFVRRRLEQEGLEFTTEADRRTLIRRLSMDLTGLPPSLDEIEQFLSDASPHAYEKLVDRLLASPHFGEHLARYWLDLVRFADTNGIHHDHFRDHSAYRDWVIRAFNDNLGYDDFIRYQLAGDLYPEPNQDQLIASGFHRLHLIIDRGTALPEESFFRNVVDRVTSFGTAFMGLTLQCAVCHDHKYDPITTQDFYSLYAFFNNIDAGPETGGRSGADFVRGLQPPYINLLDDSQAEKLVQLEHDLSAARQQVVRHKVKIKQAEKRLSQRTNQGQNGAEQGTTDSTDRTEQVNAPVEVDELKKQLAAHEKTTKQTQTALDDFLKSIPAAMIMKERETPRTAHIMLRGAYDAPGPEVQRKTPRFLPPLSPVSQVPNRMDLANWLVADDHPLTARVAVNRFWQQLFGVGLVKTSEDFGAQGEWPSHPQLLDYLSTRFIESDWDIKAIFKEIALSSTYRQTTAASSELYQRDPENRLLARGSRFRFDSEVIRDQILASSGLLNRKLYGKSVKPPQPAGLWLSVSMPSSYPREFKPDTGEKIFRRSIYTFWKRGMPPPQMTILNAPSREECIARRERTNTPLQALLLMNESEYLNAAAHLARSVLVQTDDPQERTQRIYESITSALPSDQQLDALLQLSRDLQQTYESTPDLAEQMCEGVELPANIEPAELATWTLVASAVFNLDVTKTRQ